MEEPRHKTHDPRLVLAWVEATHYRTLWRLFYNMPPNDPRFVDTDDRTILHDLAVLRYRQHLDRLSTDKRYAAEHAAADEQISAEVEERLDKMASDPEFLARMARGIKKHRTKGKRLPEAETSEGEAMSGHIARFLGVKR